jgi:hypothetical protein
MAENVDRNIMPARPSASDSRMCVGEEGSARNEGHGDAFGAPGSVRARPSDSDVRHERNKRQREDSSDDDEDDDAHWHHPWIKTVR